MIRTVTHGIMRMRKWGFDKHSFKVLCLELPWRFLDPGRREGGLFFLQFLKIEI